MAGSVHYPFIAHRRQIGGLATVACQDCRWEQAVNEDLHQGREDLLLIWHAGHPEQGFDHLSDRDLALGLTVPGYVRWTDNGSGCVAITGEGAGECTPATTSST